jgi:glycosyltransferase involved in cell wall biosynthesis
MATDTRVAGGPRVVLGMAAYNRPDTLPQVFESLLSQTCDDFAVVIVDDLPTDAVRRIVETYARHHRRISYEPNPVRLGMIGNWRRAFERGHALYPHAEFFAWISDHDVWHPRWLEVLMRALDDRPEAVLAYPQLQRVFPHYRMSIVRRFDTRGVTNRLARLRAATGGVITAGNAVYGLFRTRALEQAGVFPPVLMPDRQLIVQLSLFGEFIHVGEILWYREVAGNFSYQRQRQMLFTGRRPFRTYLPFNLQHCGMLLGNLVVRGQGRPVFGRLAGFGYALAYLWFSTRREIVRDDSRWRLALQQTALGRRVLKAFHLDVAEGRGVRPRIAEPAK